MSNHSPRNKSIGLEMDLLPYLEIPVFLLNSSLELLAFSEVFKKLLNNQNIIQGSNISNFVTKKSIAFFQNIISENIKSHESNTVIAFINNESENNVQYHASVKKINRPDQNTTLLLVHVHNSYEEPQRIGPDDNLSLLDTFKVLDQFDLKVSFTNKYGLIIYMSKSLAKLFGYTQEEIIGEVYYKQISDPAFIDTYDNKLLAVQYGSSSSESFQKRYIKKDGSKIWVKVNVSLWKGRTRNPVLMASFENLDLIKKLQREIFSNSSQIESIFKLDLGHLLLCDENKIIKKANKNIASLLGYRPFEMEGKHPDEFILPEDLQIKNREEIDKEGKLKTIEQRFVCKNGKIVWLKIEGARFETLNKERFFFICAFEITKYIDNQKKVNQLNNFQRELTTQTMALDNKNLLLSKIESYLKRRKESEIKEVQAEANKLLKLIASDVEKNSNWSSFQYVYNQINPVFFKKLLKVHPELNKNDQRHCAFIKIQLTKKEIALLLNVKSTSIDIARYRIKQKLKLSREVKLEEYINTL